MTQTKACAQCGRTFTRASGGSGVQWAKRRYCSIHCSAIAKRGRPRPPRNPDASRMDRRCECGNLAMYYALVDVLAGVKPDRGRLPLCADCADLMAQDEPYTIIRRIHERA